MMTFGSWTLGAFDWVCEVTIELNGTTVTRYLTPGEISNLQQDALMALYEYDSTKAGATC